MAKSRKQATTATGSKSDPVVRFRILNDELDRCRRLAKWRQQPDVSSYLRHLLDDEWVLYRQERGSRAA